MNNLNSIKQFKYFSFSEFQCKCCYKNNTSITLITKLDRARQISGIPFSISSGFRCVKHNSASGGSENSSHLKGLAADILIPDNCSRLYIILGLIIAGFTRIGVYNSYIHADIDSYKPTGIWL